MIKRCLIVLLALLWLPTITWAQVAPQPANTPGTPGKAVGPTKAPAQDDQPKIDYPKKTDPTDVLFIGNSYTYGHLIPKIVEAIATAKRSKLSTDMYAKGGATLEQHWENNEVHAKLIEKKWHAVVLQDQSQMPAKMPPKTIEPGLKFCEKVRTGGARPIFFLTWGRQVEVGSGMNVEMQEKLLQTYCRVALAGKAEVAPVGLAWKKCLEQNPRIKLYSTDRSHPTQAGSYLAACVMFATIYNEDPIAAPGIITIPKDSRTSILLCRLSSGEARFLQKIAWETVTEFRKNDTIQTVVKEYEDNKNDQQKTKAVE